MDSQNKKPFKDSYHNLCQALEFLATYKATFAAGLLFILLGNILYANSKLWATFIIEIGIALIVALVIIATIEKKQRDHQNTFVENTITGISQHLFNAAYKKFIPDTIFNELIECLTAANVIRTEHTVYYSIKKPEPEELKDHVICEVSSRYYLENVTNDEISQKIVLFIEAPLDPRLTTHCNINYVKVNGKELKNKIHDQPEYIDRDHTINYVHPISIKKGERVLIETNSQTVKLKNDTELWSLVHISDGITVTVDCERSLNIEINASAIHSKKLHILKESDHLKCWHLDYGTFPHQSVLIWWKEKIHSDITKEKIMDENLST